MTVRALSFDLFDTLVDLDMDGLPAFELAGQPRRGTHPDLFRALPPGGAVAFEAFCQALAAVDRELREVRKAEGRELPTLERFQALVARLQLEDPSLPFTLAEIHMGALERRATTPEHHAALLAGFGERFALALCSNFSHAPTVHRILASERIHGLFKALVISEDVGYRKPRAEIFRAVQQGLGVEPGEILHVGDRLDADVAGAARAGFRTAWLIRRVPDPEALLRVYEGPKPDLVIADLAELDAQLETLT